MQLRQVGWDECNLSTRYLSCQDVILHQTVSTNDNVGQMLTHDYAYWTNRQGIHVTMVTPKAHMKMSKLDKMMNYG